MRLPRWTVYPALVVLGALLVTALPGVVSDPHAGAAGETTGALAAAEKARFPRVVVLGIDGMDPDVLEEVLERFPDRTPNLRRLAAEGGGIHPLGTSTPPQSPVAWSSFITGLDPGGHGIFDFIHRDPVTRGVWPATVRPGDEPSAIPLGHWRLPLPFGDAGGENRTGEAFWAILRKAGVPADVWRMPANFPVEPSKGVSFPGMLTPALDSAYGECTFYTTDPMAQLTLKSRHEKVELVREHRGRIDTRIVGPENAYRAPGQHGAPVRSSVPLRIYVDREAEAVTIVGGDREIVLSPGQWSEFVRLDFSMLPGVLSGMGSISGIARFYLRSIEPELEVYASPVDVDPLAPINPVSQPPGASADLARAIGLYYTQGMAEDVNALKRGVLTDEEFMQQVDLVLIERKRMLDYALDRYLEKEDGGLLFFYVSTIDLASHMMWRHADSAHPAHDAEKAAEGSEWWSGREGSTWRDTIHDLYLKMDPVLGRIRERVGEDAVYVLMSDHGFAPYRRLFNLNTWLLENGYLVLKEGFEKELPSDHPDFRRVFLSTAVDWSRTRAYGIGFNGLYLNLAGRERDDPSTPEDESGIVQPGEEAEALLAELKERLEALRDEATGMRPVVRCDLAADVYHGPRVSEAPDAIVGFNAGYGNSDASTIGRIPSAVIEDNTGGTFNGSHLMAPELVAGVLLANAPVLPGEHRLEDLTVEILARYGVEPPAEMRGHRVLDGIER